MLVSVVITNFNYGHFLGDAIRSALQQTYGPIEVIVVDDGSTDDSSRVIESFGNRVLAAAGSHAGPCAATNKGFSMSSGEVVIFLDADDTLLQDSVMSLIAPLQNDGSSVKSQGYLNVVNKDGTWTGQRIPRYLPPSGYYTEDILAKRPRYRAPYGSGNAWRRWFLQQVYPLPEIDYPDGYLNSVAPLFGRVESVPKSVANYRIHGQNNWYGRTVFTPESLTENLQRVSRNIDYVIYWAKKTGYRPPEHHWKKWKRTWRDDLKAHALSLMDRDYDATAFHTLVFSPFMTGGTSRAKALVVSIALAAVWLAPREFGLIMARNLLQLPKG